MPAHARKDFAGTKDCPRSNRRILMAATAFLSISTMSIINNNSASRSEAKTKTVNIIYRYI